MARFVLMHLTPATRAAFRTYRDAARTSITLATAAYEAANLAQTTRHDMTRLWELGGEAHPAFVELLAQREAKAQEAEARYQQANAAATAACQAALPLMQAEGYPFGWWHTGTMRLPEGVVSPGADRLRRRPAAV